MTVGLKIALTLALTSAMALFAVDSAAYADPGGGGRGGPQAGSAQEGGGRGGPPGRGGAPGKGEPGPGGHQGGGRPDAPSTSSNRGNANPRGDATRSSESDRSVDSNRRRGSYRLIRSRPNLSAHDAALIAVQRQEALPLDQILMRLRPYSAGQVVDAMLVHDGSLLYYRLRVLEGTGAVREMYFAAKSGELVAGR